MRRGGCSRWSRGRVGSRGGFEGGLLWASGGWIKGCHGLVTDGLTGGVGDSRWGLREDGAAGGGILVRWWWASGDSCMVGAGSDGWW